MRYVGIDPGAKGALCLLDLSNPQPYFLDLDPQKQKAYTIVEFLQKEYAKAPFKTALEEVHSLPGMSAKSNFAFGGMFWRIKTLLECTFIPYELVQPKVWQKAVDAPTRKSLEGKIDLKQAIADLAKSIYPEANLHGPRGGLLDGRSDALMIAHYLKLKHGGTDGI